MIDKKNGPLSTLVEYINTHRKYVWTVLAIALYAALGFFLALQELRAQFTTQAEAADGKTPAAEFDELAYSREIRRQLINLQVLPENALLDLAMERAENTRIAILENDGALQNRINIAEIKSVAKKSDEMIKMKVTLSTTG